MTQDLLKFKHDKVLVEGLSKEFNAEIEVPGDKSISHRAVMLGSIADGNSRVYNLSVSGDNLATVAAFRKLGVNIKKQNKKGNTGGLKKDFIIVGAGFYGLKEPKSVINTSNSGTLTRLIAGMLAGNDFFSVLSGDKYLNSRPMQRIIEPLRLMGAKISGRGGDSYPPLAVSGGGLRSLFYEVPVPSAQVKSCIMLAALYAEGDTVIYERKATRDHTENLLKFQGYPVSAEDSPAGGSFITVKGRHAGGLNPFEFRIPGDFSSAAFFIALCILNKNSEITIKNIIINEKRTGLLKALKMMGADVDTVIKDTSPETAGDIKVKYSDNIKGITLPPEIVPDMIDEFPIFAVTASFAEGKTTVTGAKELRVKESDRIKAIVYNLNAIGADIKELEDGFVINGNPELKYSGNALPKKSAANSDIKALNSFGDHRIAMSMVIAGLILKNAKLEIKDINCINTSFPEFFDTLSSIIK